MLIRSLTFLLAFAVATFVSVSAYAQNFDAGSFADDARASYSRIFFFGDSPVPVPRASSTLVRNANGLSLALSTSDLEPKSAYTVWWVIFNNPENCATAPCTGADLDTEDVNGSIIWATGEVSDEFGDADFAAHLVLGEAPPGEVFSGDGLLSIDAEIHPIVRSHGPARKLSKPGRLEEALTTVFGGQVQRHVFCHSMSGGPDGSVRSCFTLFN